MRIAALIFGLMMIVATSFAQEKKEGIYLTLESFKKGEVDIEGSFVRKIGSKVVYIIDGEEEKYKAKDIYGYVMRKVDLATSEEVLAAFTNFNDGGTYYEIIERGPVWLVRNKKVYTDETGTIVDDIFFIANEIDGERVNFKSEKKASAFFADHDKYLREYHSYFKYKKRKLDVIKFIQRYNAAMSNQPKVN